MNTTICSGSPDSYTTTIGFGNNYLRFGPKYPFMDTRTVQVVKNDGSIRVYDDVKRLQINKDSTLTIEYMTMPDGTIADIKLNQWRSFTVWK